MDAIFLRPREGEAMSDSYPFILKIGCPDIALLESILAAGDGNKPHIHRRQSDAFYVVEGQLEMTLGETKVRLEAGSLALAPPGLVHAVANPGPGDECHLNIHAPSADFHELARARRDGRDVDAADFDTFAPPADGGRRASDAVFVERRGGEHVEQDGVRRAEIKVGRDELVLTEMDYAPGERGPTKHTHRRHVDSFYVLAGELEFELGDETVRAPAGTFVAAPPRVAHTFWNPSTERARFLNLHTPGTRFDEYLRERRRVEDEHDPAFLARYDIFNVDSRECRGRDSNPHAR